MNQLELCKAYLESAARVAKTGGLAGQSHGPVVTISRQAGARGNTIAEALLTKLAANPAIPHRHPWTLFNQNLIQQVIEEHAMPESAAGYLREDGVADISLMVAELLGLHPGVYTVVRRTAETIRRIALAGNAVIVGRAGNLLTADIAHSIHVRLIAPEKTRVQHYAGHEGIPLAKAAAEVARLDRARKRYVKTHYQTDISDPMHYDLVLNTGRLSDGEAVETIHAALAARCAA